MPSILYSMAEKFHLTKAQGCHILHAVINTGQNYEYSLSDPLLGLFERSKSGARINRADISVVLNYVGMYVCCHASGM